MDHHPTFEGAAGAVPAENGDTSGYGGAGRQPPRRLPKGGNRALDPAGPSTKPARNLLLVENVSRVADFLRRGLQTEGWFVTVARDGAAAIVLLSNIDFDVVVFGSTLPDMTGEEICRRMRAKRISTPTLILVGSEGGADRAAKGLPGADGTLPKAFDFDCLLERLEDLTGKPAAGRNAETGQRILCAGRLSFDTRSLKIACCDRPIALTAKERNVLRLLMSEPGKVFARERILNVVWSVSEDPLTNVVDVYVSRLRRKLGPCGSLITTVRGAGYRLSADG